MRILLLVLVFAFGACSHDWEQAERDAKKFAKKIPGSTGEVDCAHKDSDGDGYCSCTVFMEDGETVPIECGCEKWCFNCSEGCKRVEGIKIRGK